MVLPLDKKMDRKLARQTQLQYELLELREFERITDEAAAVRSVFGAPLAVQSGTDGSILPLVIIGYDQTKILRLLLSQRCDTELAARPICVIGVSDGRSDAFIDQLADSVLPPRPTGDQLLEARLILDMLRTQLERLPLAPEDRPLTLLQYMHSRGTGINPVVDGNAEIAYRYPLAENILGLPACETRDILDDMAQYSLFDRHHVDRLFTCPGCNSYRVTVKELCTECGSTHLKSQESIHHFRCGYVAPESEFMLSGIPVCPKCNGEVVHIGVEYNRPGQLVTCGQCNFWATEPLLQAWCPLCNIHHNPADLREVIIHSYAMTREAEDIARRGSWDPSAKEPERSRDPGNPTPKASVKEAPRRPRHEKHYLETLTSVILKIAREQGKPVAIYSAKIESIENNRDDEDVARLINSVKRSIRKIANESLICIEVQKNELLVALHDSPDRLTPKCRQIEEFVHRETNISISVTEVSSSSEKTTHSLSQHL